MIYVCILLYYIESSATFHFLLVASVHLSPSPPPQNPLFYMAYIAIGKLARKYLFLLVTRFGLYIFLLRFPHISWLIYMLYMQKGKAYFVEFSQGIQ